MYIFFSFRLPHPLYVLSLYGELNETDGPLTLSCRLSGVPPVTFFENGKEYICIYSFPFGYRTRFMSCQCMAY